MFLVLVMLNLVLALIQHCFSIWSNWVRSRIGSGMTAFDLSELISKKYIPENVKLYESPGIAGGLPYCIQV